MDYKKYIKNLTDDFKAKGFNRTFMPVIRDKDTFPISRIKLPTEIGNEYHNTNTAIWCSNDYLNMSHNRDVMDTMIEVIKTVGTGSGGTRNISGSTPYHSQLETDIASFHCREKALIFTSAYIANQASISTLCKNIPNIKIFSDELNHASLIEGIKNSKAECSIFKHNDIEDLENKLRNSELNRPKIIIFESLYSMDGTKTNIADYVNLAKKYNAMTFLDEVHAVGLYGENGRGVAHMYGVANDIDIINGTLSKGFGQFGGYITGDETIIEFIRSFAPGFIFTTSMMPAIAAAASKSISIVKNLDDGRRDIFNKSKYLKKKLKEAKIPFIDSDSHIIPILTKKTSTAKEYSKVLLEKHNIYIQPIFYPTVPKGKSRLRITITPKHSKYDIDNLVQSLKSVFKISKTRIKKQNFKRLIAV